MKYLAMSLIAAFFRGSVSMIRVNRLKAELQTIFWGVVHVAVSDALKR
jgi:hypothetical protein